MVYVRGKNYQASYVTFDRHGKRGTFVPLPVPYYLQAQPSVAVDSQRHPHIVMNVNGATWYCMYDGSKWSQEQLNDTGPYQVLIAIDSNDDPHIAYFPTSSYQTVHAFRDAAGWHLQAVGPSFYRPTSMRFSPDGALHILLEESSSAFPEICDERYDGSTWASAGCLKLQLGNSHPVPSLGFDSSGHVQIAYSDSQYIGIATSDGSAWTTENVVSAAQLNGQWLRSFYFGTDQSGQPRFMVVSSRFPHRSHEEAYYVTRGSGTGWYVKRVFSIVQQYYLLSPSMALDATGLPHGALTVSPVYSWERQGCGFLTAPEVGARWQSVSYGIIRRKPALIAKLQVQNTGTAGASGFKVSYYLSDDDKLDPSDTVIGSQGVAVPEGRQVTKTFTFVLPHTVGGKYLIASVTSKHPENKANPNNNMAAIALP